MGKFAAKAAFLLAISLFVFTLVTSPVSAATVVSPVNMNGWAFQVTGDGSGTFVTGPAVAPLGNGSARLFTGTQGNAPTAIHTSAYLNTDISDVTRLEYSTYSQSSGSTASLYPLLIIHVSTGSGPDTLTFDPYVQAAHGGQAAALSQWQTWNAKDGFWVSNAFGSFAGGTLSEYIAWVELFNPGGSITVVDQADSTGGLRMKTSTSSPADVFDQNVDNFTIGINGADTTYDFEPTVATDNYAQQFYNGEQTTTPIEGSSSTVTGTLLPNQSGYRLTNNWGMGSPIPGVVPVDNFSASWEGTFDFDERKYNFVGTSDNKFKIYVDGELVVNRLSRGADQGAKMMTAGVHTVKVEYTHGTGSSFINFAFYKQMVSVLPPNSLTPNPSGSCFDLNADGLVNSAEQLLIAQRVGQPYPNPDTSKVPWDLDSNGTIDSGDRLLIAQKYGKPCPY